MPTGPPKVDNCPRTNRRDRHLEVSSESLINEEEAQSPRVQLPPPPPPPHSGVGGTACVFPKSPVKGYFSRDKVRPENCKKKKKKKKKSVFDFSPGDFFLKGGVLFFSLSLWTPEKFRKGVIKYLCLLYLKIIKKLIKSNS